MNIEHIRYLNNLAEDMKNSIFSRASIMLAIDGIFLSIVGSVFMNKLEDFSIDCLSVCIYISIFATMVIGTLSVYYAIRSISPMPKNVLIAKMIVKQTNQRHKTELYSKFTMFNHVVKLRRSTFVSKVMKADEDELARDLVNSLYDLSHVIKFKYDLIHKSLNYFCLMICLFCFSILLVVIEHIVNLSTAEVSTTYNVTLQLLQ